ncbi:MULTISPECIES: DUF998 domain-containing protein [unclassified Arsukibacterium]|uniref:DUF998 domain-containing protein n=1 Tax=unclassified Arsukibacterium TaxID=2635278 RepID=UPI0025C23882|nr:MULTISPECIES: DUF998 domain-containing protein [unclassified Arsukibacterium]
MKKLIIILPVVSALWFLTTIILAGAYEPDYQHMSQYISELGATGAANGQWVNLGGFIPASVLLVFFVVMAISHSSGQKKQLLGLMGIAVYAVTLGIAALYPCDSGCRPQNPSVSQLIHNLSAMSGYLSAVAAVFLLASYVKQHGSKILSIVGYIFGAVASIMFFLLNPEFPLLGLAQRVFELSIYLWILLYSLHLNAEIRNRNNRGDTSNIM